VRSFGSGGVAANGNEIPTMNKLLRLYRLLARASQDSGRSISAIVAEILQLRSSVGRIGFSEYFDFRLYMGDLTPSQKRAFGGWKVQGILEEILIDEYARFLSLDKITMYGLLQSFGFPVPQMRAVYQSPRPSTLKALAGPAELAAYFAQSQTLPVYMKPSFGSYGRGNTLVLRIDNGVLTLGDGTTVAVDEFCAALDDGHGLGWILQEPLIPHSRIAEICGPKVSGVRVHTFLAPGGPVAVKAIWKISVGVEDSDNFRHGASGNMLAALDLETGEVLRVIGGTGFDQQVDPVHPVSGRPLVGFKVPFWSEIKALVCDANLAFPGFICPGWDVAICEDGPKILEVNQFGDIDLSQHAYRKGFLDDAMMSLLQSRALDPLLLGSSEQTNRSPKNNRLGRRTHHWRW
jgi:Sugar-transfer associated ATP-grasp